MNLCFLLRCTIFYFTFFDVNYCYSHFLAWFNLIHIESSRIEQCTYFLREIVFTWFFCAIRNSTIFDVNCTNPQKSAWNGLCGAISAVQQMVRCGKKPPQIGENAKMSQFLKVALTQIFPFKFCRFLKISKFLKVALTQKFFS